MVEFFKMPGRTGWTDQNFPSGGFIFLRRGVFEVMNANHRVKHREIKFLTFPKGRGLLTTIYANALIENLPPNMGTLGACAMYYIYLLNNKKSWADLEFVFFFVISGTFCQFFSYISISVRKSLYSKFNVTIPLHSANRHPKNGAFHSYCWKKKNHTPRIVT